MKAKLAIGSLVAFAALVIVGKLCWFGPPGMKAGANRILSSLVLTNGSRLYVVAHRTGHKLEPYTVTLYRVEHGTNAFWYYLGHEDPFWWGCSLKYKEMWPDRVEIRAFWQQEAVYSLSDDSVAWPGRKRPRFPAQKVKDQKIFDLFVGSKKEMP